MGARGRKERSTCLRLLVPFSVISVVQQFWSENCEVLPQSISCIDHSTDQFNGYVGKSLSFTCNVFLRWPFPEYASIGTPLCVSPWKPPKLTHVLALLVLIGTTTSMPKPTHPSKKHRLRLTHSPWVMHHTNCSEDPVFIILRQLLP